VTGFIALSLQHQELDRAALGRAVWGPGSASRPTCLSRARLSPRPLHPDRRPLPLPASRTAHLGSPRQQQTV